MTNVVPRLPYVVGLTLNYRDASRTLRCVRSLLADGLEHVLVWDNSADGGVSAEDLRLMLGQDSRVNLHISESNLGFAAGVNRGREWIDAHFPGAWILLINNDAVLLPGAARAMTKALQQSPGVVIVYPEIDHGGHILGTVFYQRYFGLITDKKLLGSIPYASGCCQLLDPMRLSGHWFDETFFMYGEDMELGFRLGPHRMLCMSKVWVLHEGSASSGVGSIFYETYMVAAHWILASRLADNRFELAMSYVGRVLTLSFRGLLRACRYRSAVPLRGLWGGVLLAYRQ